MGLALSGAVEEEIGGGPVSEEGLQIAGRVQGWVLVAGQSESDITRLIPIISAANIVAVVTCSAAGDIPVRTGAIGHEGVDVSVDSASDDPFVRGETLRNDKRVEGRQHGVGLRRDRRQRGDGEVAGSREGEERGRILLDGSERGGHVVLQVRGHRSHGVGDLSELCELGVERAEGKEILADRDGLLRSVKDGTDKRAHAGSQETETD